MKSIYNINKTEIAAPLFFYGFPNWDEETIEAFQHQSDHLDDAEFYHAVIQVDGQGYPAPLLFSDQALNDLPEKEVHLKRQEVLYSYNKEYRAKQDHFQDLEDRFFIENKKKYHF